MGEGLALVEGGLAEEARHVEQDGPPDDATLRDRLDACPVQTADGGAGVVAVPDLPAVPDVTERVVLRRALQERVDLVVGVVQAARESRAAAALIPVRLVQDLGALGGGAPRPDRVAFGVTDEALERERLAGRHESHRGQHLLLAEVVERAHLVVLTPLAPVARGVLQQVGQVGDGLGLGHERLRMHWDRAPSRGPHARLLTRASCGVNHLSVTGGWAAPTVRPTALSDRGRTVRCSAVSFRLSRGGMP